MPQRQAFFPVEARHEVLAHRPPFAIQQHPNLPVAVADSGLSQLPDPLPERGARVAMMAISIAGPRTADGPAGTPLTDRIRRAPIVHDDPFLRRPHHVFDSTSCSITLSNDKSATKRFSLAFSSWSCLNSRTCSDSSPAYRFFHR